MTPCCGLDTQCCTFFLLTLPTVFKCCLAVLSLCHHVAAVPLWCPDTLHSSQFKARWIEHSSFITTNCCSQPLILKSRQKMFLRSAPNLKPHSHKDACSSIICHVLQVCRAKKSSACQFQDLRCKICTLHRNGSCTNLAPAITTPAAKTKSYEEYWL